MFTITEHITHGDYNNVRSVTATTITSAAADIVEGSPYNATGALTAHGLAKGLQKGGGWFEFGWASYALDIHDACPVCNSPYHKDGDCRNRFA